MSEIVIKPYLSECVKLIKQQIMKKLLQFITIVSLAVMTATGLTSCDDGYYPGPPNGYYDPALVGDWELAQINGNTVRPSARNYLCFYGGGSGEYYYMQNGYPYSEGISYWCSNNGYGDQTVTINYSDGQMSTMYYWFRGSSLMLQWNTGGQTVTYRYLPVSYIPW